jgi:hypothetical protein
LEKGKTKNATLIGDEAQMLWDVLPEGARFVFVAKRHLVLSNRE